MLLEDRETPSRLPPHVPHMDTSTIDALIADLSPQELARLPWMLDVAIRAGWMDEAEAEVWRERVSSSRLEISPSAISKVPSFAQ